jgi:hypothetical protein
MGQRRSKRRCIARGVDRSTTFRYIALSRVARGAGQPAIAGRRSDSLVPALAAPVGALTSLEFKRLLTVVDVLCALSKPRDGFQPRAGPVGKAAVAVISVDSHVPASHTGLR